MSNAATVTRGMHTGVNPSIMPCLYFISIMSPSVHYALDNSPDTPFDREDLDVAATPAAATATNTPTTAGTVDAHSTRAVFVLPMLPLSPQGLNPEHKKSYGVRACMCSNTLTGRRRHVAS